VFTQNGLAIILPDDYNHFIEKIPEIHLTIVYRRINCTDYRKMIFSDIQENKGLIG